jgi:hypothetical protein
MLTRPPAHYSQQLPAVLVQPETRHLPHSAVLRYAGLPVQCGD